MEIADCRERVDLAGFAKAMLDGRHKEAEKVVLATDPLNTHTPASLPPADLARNWNAKRSASTDHLSVMR